MQSTPEAPSQNPGSTGGAPQANGDVSDDTGTHSQPAGGSSSGIIPNNGLASVPRLNPNWIYLAPGALSNIEFEQSKNAPPAAKPAAAIGPSSGPSHEITDQEISQLQRPNYDMSDVIDITWRSPFAATGVALANTAHVIKRLTLAPFGISVPVDPDPNVLYAVGNLVDIIFGGVPTLNFTMHSDFFSEPSGGLLPMALRMPYADPYVNTLGRSTAVEQVEIFNSLINEQASLENVRATKALQQNLRALGLIK